MSCPGCFLLCEDSITTGSNVEQIKKPSLKSVEAVRVSVTPNRAKKFALTHFAVVFPFQMQIRCHPERSGSWHFVSHAVEEPALSLPKGPAVALALAVAFFLSKPENRHFDRSCSRLCEQRSGEIRFSTEGPTNQLIPQRLRPSRFIFRVFRPKIACQASKRPK